MSDMIAEGTYRAVATPVDTDEGPVYAQFGYTKNDARQVAVVFEIVGGEEAGRKITWFGYFGPKSETAVRTIQSLRYCGFKGDDLSKIFDQQLTQEVQIVVEHDEYEGKTRAKVAWVNGGGGVKLAKPMARGDLSKFAASMKATVKKVGEVTGPTAGEPEERGDDPALDNRRRQQAPSAPAFDDDIPF